MSVKQNIENRLTETLQETTNYINRLKYIHACMLEEGFIARMSVFTEIMNTTFSHYHLLGSIIKAEAYTCPMVKDLLIETKAILLKVNHDTNCRPVEIDSEDEDTKFLVANLITRTLHDLNIVRANIERILIFCSTIKEKP